MSIPRPRPPEPRSPEADFDAVFRANVMMARRYATHLTGPDIAEDVVSEAFAVVWRRRDRLPLVEEEQRAWVIGVVRRCALAMARRERRHRTVGVQVLDPAVRDHADAVAGWDQARRLLASLPAHESEAVFLTIWAGLSAGQAARAVECTEGAFRKRLTRARQHVAELLETESRAEEVRRAR